MEIKKVKSKLTSMLLATVILLVNFNFLPVQSLINQSMSTGTVVAYAATTKPGKWIKESNGKWWYKHTDGTYTKNNWEYIDGYWYHFDANGYMQTGWLKVDGKWYHLNSEGKMHIGWVKIGNYWYHFDSNGVRQTGWQKLNGEWYYFNSDGIRQVGWQKIGNYWYHFDSNGIRQTGWQKLNCEWYYFNSDGIRQVGWQQVDGKWYHLDSNGIMETGWVKIGTDWYYFHSNGVRYVGWLTENGKTYHLNSNGIMDTGWKKINNYWYFFNSDGSMQVGWKKIDGKWYYFNPNGGTMNTKTFTENQRRYVFYSSGELRSTAILIDRQEQQKDNWCWAACSVMVGTYYTDSRRTQRNVVKEITSSTDDEPGSTAETIRAVNFASGYTKSAYSRIIPNLPDYNAVVNRIDDNRPFIMGMTWETGGGHMIVCAGYDQYFETVRIINPTPVGSELTENEATTYYNYQNLLSKQRIGKSYGKCLEMVMY